MSYIVKSSLNIESSVKAFNAEKIEKLIEDKKEYLKSKESEGKEIVKPVEETEANTVEEVEETSTKKNSKNQKKAGGK